MKAILLNVLALVCGLALIIGMVAWLIAGCNPWTAGAYLTLGVAATVSASFHIYRMLRDYQDATVALQQNVLQSRVDPSLVGLPRKELWQNVLKELDVELRQDEERENRFLFDYQGGHFYVDIDDSAFAEVYYAFIEEIELSDIEEVSLMRRAINEANFNACPTIVYSTSEEEDKMYVHMVQSVLLLPQIPQAKEYMTSRLMVFFQLQRRFVGILDRLRQEA